MRQKIYLHYVLQFKSNYPPHPMDSFPYSDVDHVIKGGHNISHKRSQTHPAAI